MIMKSKDKERKKIYNIYDKRKAECLQHTAKGGDTMYLLHFELTQLGAIVTKDSATGNRADAATARTSSSSSLRAVTIGSNTRGSKSLVKSC